MKPPKALLVEGHKIGTRFRVGTVSWGNGSACSDEVAAQLKAEGYILRQATQEEAFTDDRVQSVRPVRHLGATLPLADTAAFS
ncbi:MAG TPA: hypothetical protein VGF86_09400 [Candidatus Tumulicola sp.]